MIMKKVTNVVKRAVSKYMELASENYMLTMPTGCFWSKDMAEKLTVKK